jgi:cyclophilin family peptidyl-prolyl cis-trans isomerase
MANKKKIQERLEEERKARQTRYIQIGGAAIVVLIIALGLVYAGNNKAEQSTVSFDGNVGAAGICDNFADIPVAAQYSEPPMRVDSSKQYFATVKMATGGEFVIQLYPDKAPITVNSFVFLSCKGFFDGVTFHRVLEGFMAQGGDPSGTGGGGPGYQFVNELNDLNFDKAGVVAMANAGRDTNGSQFFIMFGPYGLSESDYTIFGQVVEGMDVVNGITRRDPQTGPTFSGDAIQSVTITEN